MQSKSDKNKIATIFRTGYMILAGLLLVLSYLYKSYFLAGCSICVVLFGLIQIRLIFISRKDETHQQKKCKVIGFVLLIPAMGMIASGVALILLVEM